MKVILKNTVDFLDLAGSADVVDGVLQDDFHKSARDVRQQGQVAAALDAAGELALVGRTVARDAGGQDLARVGEEGAQDLDLLVVDVADLLGAEAADLAAG